MERVLDVEFKVLARKFGLEEGVEDEGPVVDEFGVVLVAKKGVEGSKLRRGGCCDGDGANNDLLSFCWGGSEVV